MFILTQLLEIIFLLLVVAIFVTTLMTCFMLPIYIIMMLPSSYSFFFIGLFLMWLGYKGDGEE